ncbi:ABC transporter C family member 10-like [Papaver somniferum]|uniref:ABC transporter C family member 10-like n=1 Tax=Papaver somniferum TaxID=3469 RepID=UPI000E6FAD54|nr:ABC transporter C family member 10-like [Papaver somniferum]
METRIRSDTPFAKAGFLSKLSFWWLNPLMKKGKKETLEDDDIPMLRKADRAETCYLLFMEQLKNQKKPKPSILWTIVLCYWKEIFISGFFAFVKVVTFSAGPLFLGAFIDVAEGKEAFKHEGYILVILLFLTKFIESLSQRQWYFRCRLLGLKVRSLLSAAIYKKQLGFSGEAKTKLSASEIINYVTVDCYQVGEFPIWLHQIWTACLQMCLGLAILFRAVGLASLAALVVIVLSVVCNTPLAKLQLKFQLKLVVAQDKRLKAISEAIVNMKVLKLYAWEMYFKSVIERLRKEEVKILKASQLLKAYNVCLFWISPILVSSATFICCYLIGVPLNAKNVFIFVASLRIVQEPIRQTPDIIGMCIRAKVAFGRIVEFLAVPECGKVRKKEYSEQHKHAIYIRSSNLSWEENTSVPTLRSIDLEVKVGEKVAICGEVGAGKSTLLAAILGEIPEVEGTVQVYGKIAYVSQTAWIQSGSIKDNVLFGCTMDKKRYQETLEKCSLVKDLEMLPYGDLTEIGERGINLSGGQKQRIQLARALYQDADIYLLDDPFSAVDALTAISIFNEYIMGALSEKAVLLVTHQVDFLRAFDSILLMSDGKIQQGDPYHVLLSSNEAFRNLVNTHKDTAGAERHVNVISTDKCRTSSEEIEIFWVKQLKESFDHQLTEQEERETGYTGLKAYVQYLSLNKGFFYFSVAIVCQIVFFAFQIVENYWMAANVQNPQVSKLRLILVYSLIGCSSMFFVLFRCLLTVALGIESSKSLFDQLLNSLFHAPTTFYESTPFGRILSRVSSDLGIVDLDLPVNFVAAVIFIINICFHVGVLAVITWQVLLGSILMMLMVILLQRYYSASAKEFMRINGTSKSMIASHLGESIAGAMTIRAFEKEDRFFSENLDLIDNNAGPSFHIFSANEWLILRLEMLCTVILCSSALVMVLLPAKTFGSGFVGMALSYGLSLNLYVIVAVHSNCSLTNDIVSVERLNQYLHIPSEAPELVEGNRPFSGWPAVGRVEIHNLEIRYRLNTPIVLHGINCIFEGGHKIGIVGRTGSGKSTLIGALFRLVEPVAGKIIIDDIDISTIGLHDLRSRLGIIPQDPTLFNGTVRYNLDPLSKHTDQEIWEVLGKCQLRETVQEKEKGLDSSVQQDGVNWSVGQRQLFCLGRALLRSSQILVLDEATASIDSATDSILQKTIRTEFKKCTVITVAHRIPTVMDSTMVLGISDGKIVEYDEPLKLIKEEGSLFGQLVNEYWSHSHSAYS